MFKVVLRMDLSDIGGVDVVQLPIEDRSYTTTNWERLRDNEIEHWSDC